MRLSKMAIVGIVLMSAAFGARYFLAPTGFALDFPIGVGARGYNLPLSFLCFWLLVLAGFFLLAIGIYRGRAR